jgi:hemin uptake protein HemP
MSGPIITIDDRTKANNAAITQSISDRNTSSATLVQGKNAILLEKDGIYNNQLKEIESKEKLLLTRSRMLQIAQDRNSYKTKVLYTLMAILVVILIINLIIWAMRGKRGGNSSNK